MWIGAGLCSWPQSRTSVNPRIIPSICNWDMPSIIPVLLVVVLVRSQELSQKFPPSFCSSFSTYSIRCTPSDSSLHAATAIFRHGERRKTFDIPELYNVNSPADGKLTAKGKECSRQLGAFLKCRYGSFLSSSPSPTVNVMSSNTNRTVDTAVKVLEGLKINVPIDVIPSDKDNRIFFKASLCPSYEKSLNAYKSLAFVPHPNLVELLSNVTSDVVKTYDDVYKIYDTVLIEHCQFDVALPSWFSATDLHPFYTHYFIGWVHDRHSARLFNGPFLHDILVSQMKGDREMSLYSAHDTTIATMMEVMDIYESSHPPPYNVILIFEVHKMVERKEVRVFYGGDGKETLNQVSLSWCPTPCSLDQFNKRLLGFSTDEKGWSEECKLEDI